MSDKHMINHLQLHPLHQSKDVPSHISTQTHPPNTTGHQVLIFHPSEYLLANNGIYTKLSMFEGGLPSLLSTAGMFTRLQDGLIWNLASISFSCDLLRGTEDMEFDDIEDNDICAWSEMDEDQQQQRCLFNFFL